MDENLTVAKLSYFNGGVPPLTFFQLRTQELRQLSAERSTGSELDFVAELCMIGLAAYFEAFCKDQFAAIINIAPKTLIRFTDKHDCRIPVRNLLHDLSNVSQMLGFVVAQESEFGTAGSINSLFGRLLNLTPFGRSDVESYSEFLRDRNLLVHDGGVFTMRYVSQKFNSDEIKRLSHHDSLRVGQKDVEKWAIFLFGLALKLAKASSKGGAPVRGQQWHSLRRRNQESGRGFGMDYALRFLPKPL